MKISLIEIVQYILIFLVFSAGAVLFQRTADNIDRFLIVIGMAVFYVIWGIWHHHSKSRLNKEIILEYVLVAVLALLLIALGLGIFRSF